MESSRNSARQLLGLTLTLVGLLSWNILPIPHAELAVRAANRAKVAEPTGQPVSRVVANGRIAFVSSQGNAQSDIYTMNPDGSDRKQLTFSQEDERQPAWSPDGTKIAFAREHWNGNGGYSDIFVMNADGSDQRMLIQSRFDQFYSLTWSPDGTKIAFWRIDNIPMVPSSMGIFVMNADGSDQRAVASTSNLWEPAWSPDGLKLAVTDNGNLGTYGIYLIKVDGSNQTQITQPPTSPDLFEDHNPAWSPDGSKITFIRCADGNGFGCWDTTSHLWVVNADGSNPTKLTDTQAWSHAWSPDGTKIILSNAQNSGGDLLVMNPDGSGLTNITNTTDKHEESPSWQPLPLTLPNPIGDPQFFVRQQYRDFLNREPDPPGLAHWTGEITACDDPSRRQPGESLELCIERKRTNTSAAFFLSPEFQYTGYFVYRLYKGSLIKNGVGRVPTYQEFLRDVRQVASGIIQNNQLSASAIEANKKTFAEDFIQRAEFRALYDPLSNFDYVERLFQTTGINVSATEKQALVDGLNNQTETRASVLQKVVDGTVVISEGNQQFTTAYGRAFYEKEFNPAFVLMEYFGYLQRDPDAPGYQHWLDKLNLYHNYIDAEMVKSFLISPEYRSRFGPP